MTLIYVVEDNPDLLSDALIWLNTDDLECRGAADSKALDALLLMQLPDLIVLDWMLPGEDGLTIAHKLRASAKHDNIGIVFMTARRDIDDRLAGLDVADAYMAKPVDYRELKAVINSVVRRLSPHSTADSVFWLLNINKLTIKSPINQVADLTERELIILMLLLQQPDKIVTIEEINRVLGLHYPNLDKSSLERLISRLRAKLKSINVDNSNPIRSYRHKGYRLTLPISLNDS
tara:strand:- start:336 stop:1034 length:699 start_codon:yes stop_codon:yes gene_type:complete